MTVHFKSSGAWQQASDVYVKVNGVWVRADQVLVKRSGAWAVTHEWDETPPQSPEVSLQVVNTTYTEGGKKKSGRRIRVGIQIPGNTNNPDVKFVRVLVTKPGETKPANYLGKTYLTKARATGEPWAEWHYNGSKGINRDTFTEVFRNYPPDATAKTDIPAGKYTFTAWSCDHAGNWSLPVEATITVPSKRAADVTYVVREAFFEPNWLGTWEGTLTSGSFVPGHMQQGVVGTSPRRGVIGYGAKISEAIPNTNNVTIRSAKLKLTRMDTTGVANANLYVGWHDKGAIANMTGTGPQAKNITAVGKIAKGETRWVPLPDVLKNNLKTAKGFELNWKDPAAAGSSEADQTIIRSDETAWPSGTLHVVWEEDL